MAHVTKLPTIPKLYKVLRNGESQSGGRFTWNTTPGAVNHLPLKDRNKPLQHCQVGFHLTTDWRKWYSFGDDVYTAIVPNGQIVLKQNMGWDYQPKDCQDKVVADQVKLSEKNKDPLAKLLKAFWDDIPKTVKQFNTARARHNRKVPGNSVRGRISTYVTLPWNSVSFSGTITNPLPCNTPYSVELSRTIRFVIGILCKSVDSSITALERKQVHDVWNLWKKGWAVHGINNQGKYVVS